MSKIARTHIYFGTVDLPHRNLYDEDVGHDQIDVVIGDNEKPLECMLERAQLGKPGPGTPSRRLIQHRYRLVTIEELPFTEAGLDALPPGAPIDAEVVEIDAPERLD